MNFRTASIVLAVVAAAASVQATPGAYSIQDVLKISHSSFHFFSVPSEQTDTGIGKSAPAGDSFSNSPIESFLVRDGGVDGAEGGEVDKRERLEPTYACRMM
jgi:hypothetical protein